MVNMLQIKANLNNKGELKEETISIASGKLTVKGEDGEVLSINTKDIEKASIEEGVGIAKLIIKRKDGSESEAAYFTKSEVKMFAKFSEAINQYIVKNKAISATFTSEKKNTGGISTIYWLYNFTKDHRKILTIGVALSLVLVFLNLIPPYLLKVLIDNVILSQTHSISLFEELTIILIASYAASAVISTIQQYALSIAGNRIVTDLRSKFFDKAVKLPAGDIDTITPTRILTRLTTDTGNMNWLMTYGLSTVITNALTIIGIGVILFLLFPALAIYVLLPIPFLIVLIIRYNSRSDRAYHKSWRRSADLTTKINDVIPNYTIVKSANKADFEGEEFNEGLDKYYETQMGIQRMELVHWQPVGFLLSIAAVIIWWVGGNLVIVGTLQLGVVTAFLAYMGMFYSPIQQLSTYIPYLQEAVTSGERIREVFDSESKGKEPTGTKKPNLFKDIKFNDVWFGYDPLFPVIKGMTTTIEKGKITSVMGKSGAGKSTVSKLLLGLYKIDSGAIKFGEVNINDIDVNYLRSRIAYVPQDSTFFENTIAYNILYFANKTMKPIELISVGKAVEMHQEIMRFPLCYDNRIRGRGMSLSGGQRQRLAIARALLSGSDIIVLDEITANLDAINARKINNMLVKLESNKTMVFVTHDITEIMDSDYAIVLDNGTISEQGKPTSLIKKKGALYEMFKYKLTARSKSRPNLKRNTLAFFVKDYVVDEKELKIEDGERRSFVNLIRNSKLIKRLTPKRPFPVSNPEFIIFYAKDGKEDLFAIENYNKLDAKSRQVLEHALEASNFSPKVTSIKYIKITGDGLDWGLKTDKGDMVYNTKNRSDIVSRGNYIILIDEFNTPLKIDVRSLDKASLDLLERSV
jgi:ATP-binding cassette, subfamily C, bacterial